MYVFTTNFHKNEKAFCQIFETKFHTYRSHEYVYRVAEVITLYFDVCYDDKSYITLHVREMFSVRRTTQPNQLSL